MAAEQESFARRLTRRREAAGLSREEAARQLEISPEKYADWEDGLAVPEGAQLRSLAKLLSIPKDELPDPRHIPGRIGPMFPSDVDLAAPPRWNGLLLAGSLIAFLGGVGLFLLILTGSVVEKSSLLVRIFLVLLAAGGLCCLIAAFLRLRDRANEIASQQREGDAACQKNRKTRR